nr:ribonuclease H-like domain-containing protein [Tanacetum cinerariifolium]
MNHEQPPTAQNEIPHLVIPSPPKNLNPDSVHPMVMRFCVGTNRLTERLNLHVSSVSHLPKSYRVPQPTDTNIVHCMWLFRHKYLAYGMLSRYKARLVANGSAQLEEVDVDETFSPVVKPSIIWTVLILAVSRHWLIHSLDVKNAFLHGDFSKTVYMHQPPGSELLGLSPDTRDRVSSILVGILLLSHSSPSYLRIAISIYGVSLGRSLRQTLVDSESKQGPNGDPIYDLTLYRSLAG